MNFADSFQDDTYFFMFIYAPFQIAEKNRSGFPQSLESCRKDDLVGNLIFIQYPMLCSLFNSTLIQYNEQTERYTNICGLLTPDLLTFKLLSFHLSWVRQVQK